MSCLTTPWMVQQVRKRTSSDAFVSACFPGSQELNSRLLKHARTAAVLEHTTRHAAAKWRLQTYQVSAHARARWALRPVTERTVCAAQRSQCSAHVTGQQVYAADPFRLAYTRPLLSAGLLTCKPSHGVDLAEPAG